MSSEAEPKEPLPRKVVIRSFPKILLLYPTLIAALVAGVCSTIWPPEHQDAAASPVAESDTPDSDATPAAPAPPPRTRNSTVALVFLAVLGVNMIVFSFDFPRTTSLTLFFLIVAVVSVAIVLNQYFEVIDSLAWVLGKLRPQANNQFYFLMSGGLIFIYLVVYIATRFDYWEVMHNELIHHHGILGNVNRYPAPQLKLEKEIVDVFELFLLRSGRLLVHPSSERHAIVLENVPNINRKEELIQEMLRALSVHIHNHEYADDDG